MPAIRWAKEELPKIEQIGSYTARLVKREQLGGRLGPTELLTIKVRENPYSVYAKYLGPKSMKGQEALFVESANDGKMWAHGAGLRGLVGTLAIEPTDPLAMKGERYPLTQIGILKLTQRLIEVAESDLKYGECSVKWIDHAKINGRSCQCLEVVHPHRRTSFTFHIARVFADDKLGLPVRYEAYDWPKAAGGEPPLLEEYTYLDIDLDANLSAADFDVHNPAYHFRPSGSDTAARSHAATRR
jgi:hypothetical protein